MELRESSGRPFSDWLKKGLLSGKISGVVMGVTDLIFYLAFAVCYSWSFIRQTTLFTRIMTHDQRHFVDGIYNNMALVAILCGIVALLLQNSVRLAVFEGVLAAAGYACWKEGSGKAYLFVMCALIVGATGRSFRVILSETVFLGTVLMICAVSASQMGIIEALRDRLLHGLRRPHPLPDAGLADAADRIDPCSGLSAADPGDDPDEL